MSTSVESIRQSANRGRWDWSINSDTLRESVGFGFRWNSPMGPIALAYGYKLDPREGENKGNWEFALGAAF